MLHYVNRETRCVAMLEDIICAMLRCLLGNIWDKGRAITQSWKMYGTKKKGDFSLNKKVSEVMDRILIIQRYTEQTRGLSTISWRMCVCTWVRASLELCRIKEETLFINEVWARTLCSPEEVQNTDTSQVRPTTQAIARTKQHQTQASRVQEEETARRRKGRVDKHWRYKTRKW